MAKYLIKRVAMMIITLFLIALLTFVLMHAVPGGPFTSDKQVSKAVLDALNEKYRLNDPLWKQFVDYLGGLVRLDLGPSFKYQGKTVNDFINNGLPYSARLGAVTLVFVDVCALTLMQPGAAFLDLLYECASAMGTVGISAIGSASLAPMARLLIILTMFAGRVGPLTLALLLTRKQNHAKELIQYPEEHVMIG